MKTMAPVCQGKVRDQVCEFMPGAQARHFRPRKVVQTLNFVIVCAGFNGRRSQVRWLAVGQRVPGLEQLFCSRDKFPVPCMSCVPMSSVGCLQCAEREQGPLRRRTAPMCGAKLSHFVTRFLPQCAPAMFLLSHENLRRPCRRDTE